MSILSPLEQFRVIPLVPLYLGNFDISFTNTAFYSFLVFGILYLIFVDTTNGPYLIPSPLQRLAEVLYLVLNSLVKQQAGIKSLQYFPILSVLFFFILFSNLLGLVPYGFTTTSQATYTFTFGFSFFIGVLLIGLTTQRFGFFKQFIPATSGPIVPLLVVIEVFSYCIRPLSLSIRLFANMLAGHTLLHIIAGFAVSLFKIEPILGLHMFMPIIAVCVLEFGIAFLQAYVFIVLLCIYLKESFYGH